jgi:hypothetical protein
MKYPSSSLCFCSSILALFFCLQEAIGMQSKKQKRMGFFALCSALMYMVDVISDAWTISDLIYCGGSIRYAGIGMLYYIICAWFTWFLTVHSYVPADGGRASKAMITFMPQGFIMLSTITWCDPTAVGPASVLAISPLLHILESMVEAVPVSLLLWTHLFIQANGEAWRQDRNRYWVERWRSMGKTVPSELLFPAQLPPLRRLLWLVTLASSCTRVVTGTYSWVKHNKKASGEGLKHGERGLEDMCRHLEPPLEQNIFRAVKKWCLMAVGVNTTITVALAIAAHFTLRY